MNIQLIRMQSGEDVVADLIEDKGETLVIGNPIVLVPGRDGTVGFAPWSPILAPEVKELEIRASYTVYVSTPNDDVVNNYNSIFSPITVPNQTKSLIL